MSSNKLKHYELYTGTIGGKIYNKTADYQPGMYVVKVAAFSIKQAYYLCSKMVWKTDIGEPGVLLVSNNSGSKSWKEV